MANEKLFHIGVKALIQDKEGKVLLFLADVSNFKDNFEPYWDIPGGRIQEGFTVLDTLKREIEEETGITSIVGKPEFLTAVVSNHEIPISDTQMVGLLLMVYKVAIPEDAVITLSEEHTKYEWVDKAEAVKRLAHKYPPEFTETLE